VKEAASSQRSSYRSDIDGLRAVAVLSVIFYHMNKELLPGGFIGVDVFFVISGFLISGHIFEGLDRGSFSILEFYRRRIKRIAPAMLTVVAVTLGLAWFFLLPEDTIQTAKSAVFAVASLANVYFWHYQDTSYFAADSRELPLLHLWSLGVEEQFYAIWPLVLTVSYRRARQPAFFLAALAIVTISFCLGNIWAGSAPLFAYYMLPTRAGELLMGTLVAIAVLRGAQHEVPSAIMLFLTVVGMVLLAGSLFGLSEHVTFPGVAAIPPTLGTALLIFVGAGRQNRMSRCLSAKPLVQIGLISYSMYLWHWPLLAIYRYGYGEITLRVSIAIFMFTLLLAWITYFYIEQPLRRSSASVLAIFVRQYAVPSAILAGLSLGLVYHQPLIAALVQSAYTQRLARVGDKARPANDYDYVCQRQRLVAADATDDRCVIGAGPGLGDDVLLWGDSNAAHYVGMIGVFANEAGFRFRNIELGSCPPILANVSTFVAPRRAADCRDSLPVIRHMIDKAHTIIVSALWTSYQGLAVSFLDVFFQTMREITRSGKQVIIIGKAPVTPGFDRRCSKKALHFPFLSCRVPDTPLGADIAEINERLSNFARQSAGIQYFDVSGYLCPHGLCSAYGSDGEILYYDSDHLTMVGSWRLGNKILTTDGVPNQFKQIAVSEGLY
jgi:peptidoglycan/LPS O-acetylase OafA/YrhL